MRPNRPDSAKSAQTKITIDSEFGGKDLTVSKFSQTYSTGVKKNKDDFSKYVEQKNKDPKFKKYMESNLPQIPQKTKKQTELSKLTSKPFQKKTSKIEKEKVGKKIEQEQKREVKQTIQSKYESSQTSKSFIDKSKQKLKSMKNTTKEDQKQKQKSKINFNGFTVNVPGKGKKVVQESPQKQVEKQQKKKQDKEDERKRNLEQLQSFIDEIEGKNVNYYPKEYDEFVEKSQCSEIDKVNIQDFMSEPNERDYSKLVQSIANNDKRIDSSSKLKQSSVNLDQIIDGNGQQFDDSVVLSCMTVEELRERNMFVTQIMRGKINEDQINQVKSNDKHKAKLIKIEETEKIQKKELEDDEVQVVQLNIQKKKTNKILQRNKLQAGGHLYQQCDYMTEQQRKRIDDLINGVQIESPFQFSQMEQLRNRGIQQGIYHYRKYFHQDEQQNQQQQQVIAQSSLPKDPILKKEAQLKRLKEKINEVNERLRGVNSVVINKTKIQKLIEKCKQKTPVSKMGQSIIQQKEKQLQEQSEKLRRAEQFLVRAQGQKQQINTILQQMQDRFNRLSEDLNRLMKMDVEQRYEYELQALKGKKKAASQLQNEALRDIQELQKLQTILGQQFRESMSIFDQITNIDIENIDISNYSEHETLQDLDKIITIKWEAAEKAVQNIQNMQQQ